MKIRRECKCQISYFNTIISYDWVMVSHAHDFRKLKVIHPVYQPGSEGNHILSPFRIKPVDFLQHLSEVTASYRKQTGDFMRPTREVNPSQPLLGTPTVSCSKGVFNPTLQEGNNKLTSLCRFRVSQLSITPGTCSSLLPCPL